MTQETREAIGKVRALIAQGWTQGAYSRYVDGRLCYCLSGAIGTVPGYDTFYKVRDAIRLRLQQSIVAWNDEPGRTQEDVLRLLDSVLEEGA